MSERFPFRIDDLQRYLHHHKNIFSFFVCVRSNCVFLRIEADNEKDMIGAVEADVVDEEVVVDKVVCCF